MEEWERVFVYGEPEAAAAAVVPAASPPTAPPMFWSPMPGISTAMGKTAKASIERGKAMYVDLPCFTC